MKLLAATLMFVISLTGPATAAAGTPHADSLATITYEISDNGQVTPEEGTILVSCDAEAACVRSVPAGTLIAGAPRESGYIDFAAGRTCQVAELRDGSRCSVTTEFSALPVLEMGNERAEILGFACRKATTVLRSNRLEIWFTRDTPLRGSHSLNLLVPDGLVLKIVRNGNHEIVAKKFERDVTQVALRPAETGTAVDAAEYRARVTAGWVTTVPIFQDEQVCFDPAAVDSSAMADALPAAMSADTSAVLRFSAGTLLLRKVQLPRLADAMLFAHLVERSNGDAYDRTGSVFLLPTDRPLSFLNGLLRGVAALPITKDRDGRVYQGIAATDEYLPPLELIRFITPFGVGHYNGQVKVKGLAWADSVVYKQDLSELLPTLQGSVWIGAFVGNYDKGGHRISLTLSYHPNNREVAEAPAATGWMLPLFNTVNLLEMSGQEYGRIFAHDSLSVDFDLPPGIRDLRLRYLTTGHGGWGGGDEFNPKRNTILLDGREIGGVTPWRSDCASYRSVNPASGNFWNGVSSSDLSRSGWCPGAAAEPVTIPLSALAPGRHRLQVAIPLGEPEGGSFSAWNVSGVLLGELPQP